MGAIIGTALLVSGDILFWVAIAALLGLITLPAGLAGSILLVFSVVSLCIAIPTGCLLDYNN